MPAKPSYSQRLGAAVAFLELRQETWIDRKTVEEALGVSKTVAWRLMRQSGATSGPGGTLVCERDALLTAFRAMLSGGVHRAEIERQARVERLLENLRPSVRSRMILAAEGKAAERMLSQTMAGLPAGVTLTSSSLTIEFHGMEEFLARFGAVVFALHNDYDKMEALLASTQAVRPAGGHTL